MFSTISDYIFGKSSEGVTDTILEADESVEEAKPKDLQISEFQQLSSSVTSETIAEDWEVVSLNEFEEEGKSINAEGNTSIEIEEAQDAVIAQELARENYLIENPCSDISNTFRRPHEANDPAAAYSKSKSLRRLVKNSKPRKDIKNAQLRLLCQQKLQLSHSGDGSGCINKPKPSIHHNNHKYQHGGKCRNDNFHYTRKSNVNNDRKCGKMQW